MQYYTKIAGEATSAASIATAKRASRQEASLGHRSTFWGALLLVLPRRAVVAAGTSQLRSAPSALAVIQWHGNPFLSLGTNHTDSPGRQHIGYYPQQLKSVRLKPFFGFRYQILQRRI